jgi:ssDNA-binding replication factor A large subunit
MVGKELGVTNDAGTKVKISELTDGMKDIEIKGIIKNIYPTKEFEKEGKSGKLVSFLLDDNTGLIRVTLWNDQVDKYHLTVGSEIQINNGVISSYNEKSNNLYHSDVSVSENTFLGTILDNNLSNTRIFSSPGGRTFLKVMINKDKIVRLGDLTLKIDYSYRDKN